LKQGQVEIDPTNFIADYKDSALLHRSVVEELNTNIKVAQLFIETNHYSSLDDLFYKP
jgi:hypothetical protein